MNGALSPGQARLWAVWYILIAFTITTYRVSNGNIILNIYIYLIYTLYNTLYTFIGITTIDICTTTHDTLSATAFVAQLTERRTRFAGVREFHSPRRDWSCIFSNWSRLSLWKFTHLQNILIVYLHSLFTSFLFTSLLVYFLLVYFASCLLRFLFNRYLSYTLINFNQRWTGSKFDEALIIRPLVVACSY